MTDIAIIQYNAGNVQSVQYALKRLGFSARVTADENELKTADKIIFPGVGHAAAAMKSLEEKGLDKLIPQLRQPVLGICVGMQLLCNHSEEGDTKCLGIIDTEVRKFKSVELKIPQVGWNNLYNYKTVLLDGIPPDAYVYFVHSYYAALCKETVAQADYGLNYSAMLQKDNFYGVQFHTEKSAETGDRILYNFLKL